MNKARTLYAQFRYGYTALARETEAKIIEKKKKADFVGTPKKTLQENLLENFVLGLETKPVAPNDLATVTSFFKLWNQFVVSKTVETKSAAIHELMMMIANCDPKVKIETAIHQNDKREGITGFSDYAFYQVSWPFPVVVFEDRGQQYFTFKKCAMTERSLIEKYRFPRAYGIITDLDKWIFNMYDIYDPKRKFKTYTYSLDLSDESKLQENIEDIIKTSYAFIRHALHEYKTLKYTVTEQPEQTPEEAEEIKSD